MAETAAIGDYAGTIILKFRINDKYYYVRTELSRTRLTEALNDYEFCAKYFKARVSAALKLCSDLDHMIPLSPDVPTTVALVNVIAENFPHDEEFKSLTEALEYLATWKRPQSNQRVL